jgi:phthalate 4,5-dioxygenase oxygenase subunit
VHITAYPTIELGGIVWTYMGPADKMPAPPKFAWTQAPQTHRHASKVIQECNWLQALEGGLDTSHAPILHRLISESSGRGGIKPSNPYARAGAPKLVVDLTDYGYAYAGVRPLSEHESFARTYHFILPFHQIRGSNRNNGDMVDAGHIWVPIEVPLTEEDRLEGRSGNGPAHVDQTTFRSQARRQNDYLLDRRVQRAESYSGIDGVNTQDRAIQESMGRIVDRSKEYLGPADKAIIQTRRLLVKAVKTVEAGGTPDGVAPSYYTLTCGTGPMPRDADWRDVFAPGIARERILQTV